jgi:tricorn protease-like protein/C-terminal processing protease CtpA/Prc
MSTFAAHNPLAPPGDFLVSKSTILRLAAGAACAIASLSSAQVQPTAGMLRFPAVSKDRICFSYANDLWTVSRDGGVATPLSSPPGAESFPRFSPDGKSLAFIANYDGDRDVYSMSADGGTPTRVTYHPAAETVAGWTPDNKILFLSNGLAGLARQSQLFTVAPTGGLPERVGVPYAGFGAISSDGQWLAYTPHSTDNRTWKRYRGGMATDIWLFNLNDNSATRITEWEGTDTLPMWNPAGDANTVYYLSDNGPEHRLNIWRYDVATKARTQVTSFTDDDVRWPSIGPGAEGKGEIVFQLGGALMLLDLGSNQSRAVNVTVPGDRPFIRERTVNAADYIQGATISPSGKRIILEARGDLWSLPAKEGSVRGMTRTDAVAERDPAWSPDGKWIAYFSDETGENELWVRPSGARPDEEKDDKEKGGDAKDGDDEDPANTIPWPRPEPRKLTSFNTGYRFSPTWSPDSQHITTVDENGRIYVTTVDSGQTKELDKDPQMNQASVSWSSDSQWIAYPRADDGNTQQAIWIANVESGEKHRVTNPMFNAAGACFDRNGDFLFVRSNRTIEDPTYSDIDTTFVYTATEAILMIPLRNDVKNPWLPKSDEETLKADKKPTKGADKTADGKKSKPGDSKDSKANDAKSDDAVTGTWEGTVTIASGAPDQPPELTFKLLLTLDGDKVTGAYKTAMHNGEVLSGEFNQDAGALKLTLSMPEGQATLEGEIKDDELKGTWSAGEMRGTVDLKRTSTDAPDADKDATKKIAIDFDDIERRAIPLPIDAGNFGAMAVADGEKLVYSRRSQRGSDEKPSIKMYEYTADERGEKTITNGGNFIVSGDGKKLLVFRGGREMLVCIAVEGGGKPQTISTGGMSVTIQPREEWNQIFSDSWRIMRDYFYEPTMHGVDWPKMRTHYGAMIPDAASREDLNWIISEMISELNVGHAYLSGPGDVERVDGPGAGLLGCDYELVRDGDSAAYRITKIYEGAPWDSDARGPLSQPGVDVKVGDFLLAIDGMPVRTDRDPWAALVGKAGRVVTLTVSEKPTLDGSAREVLVKTLGSEVGLRYRAWIERNRAYVEEKSNGKVGYIYVPNTGTNGQDDLFRQFYGQREKAALIIDERWNGGGQIPNRFIELLNRPVTNYWARRDGADWVWPPDSHQGTLVMLANGLAGSGGDMFPWLFKHHKLGTLIGTRTWGGLVGLSGNPGFIDNGRISVPTFGFYETDGTWGIEGHGVEPDIEVLDDPSKMINGGDPQLDKAIEVALDGVAKKPYTPPARPKSPNRSGMGLPDSDR